MGDQVVENVEPLRSTAEIQNMREALNQTTYPKRNNLLFSLGINTGLRIGDLLQLRIEDVKGRSSVKIQEGKTSKSRLVHLDAVMADIAEYLGDQPNEGYLFASQRTGKPMSTVQAYRILKAAGEKCGYDYVGTHTMRKTFGYHYFQQTKDIVTLMVIFNHSSQNITKRYIGIEEDDIKNSLKDFRL
ncbi:tyrosine-type recombinase/integrase [Barrientosiimonas marina]|uniref:Tyrosine-type recombinase/integrase n=1 Tax=Lentibacillus kimchii TaxID=1542911 RepID=A0ABW2UXJ3_9BACI